MFSTVFDRAVDRPTPSPEDQHRTGDTDCQFEEKEVIHTELSVETFPIINVTCHPAGRGSSVVVTYMLPIFWWPHCVWESHVPRVRFSATAPYSFCFSIVHVEFGLFRPPGGRSTSPSDVLCYFVGDLRWFQAASRTFTSSSPTITSLESSS